MTIGSAPPSMPPKKSGIRWSVSSEGPLPTRRFQTAGSGNDFPYYVFRVATDLVVSKIVTWNVVGFRYRDAFDSSNDYLTPQLGTGLTFKVSQHGSISGKVDYNWKDWNPEARAPIKIFGASAFRGDSVGFSLGYKHAF